jgi:hypothetical protein
MNQQEATATIANLLTSARTSIETALSMGREHNVPVDLNIVGLGGDDMWYVSEQDWLEGRLEELKYDYPEETGEDYEAEVKRINDELAEIRSAGGFDSYGYKQTGWMSSSTNC